MARARHGVRAGLAVVPVAWVGLLASAGLPQDSKKDPPAVDPYTKGDRAAMEAAGIVSFGPFRFGDDLTSERVASILGGEPLIWMETLHFRLGSTLEEIALPDDPIERKRLGGELERLRERLRGLKGKPKKIDPWLRLHLYAQRVEDLYAEFQRSFALTDAGAPPDESATSAPFLGMKEKFSVLLLQRPSTLARFTNVLCGEAWETSYRYYFAKTGGLFVGFAFESLGEGIRTDLTLQYALTFLLTENLYDGFRGYDYLGPIWWRDGLARWFARRVDERCLLYTAGKDDFIRDEEEARWEPKVRARVEKGAAPSTAEMLAWPDPENWEFAQHMMAWSRVDFVMHKEPPKRRAFLLALQEPMGLAQGAPSAEAQAQHFDRALQALGYDPGGSTDFDRDWAAWVLETYSKR